jgi:hypothetical protein
LPASITRQTKYPENNVASQLRVNLRDFKSIDVFSELGVTLNNTHLYTGVSQTADGSIRRGLSNVTVSNRNNANRFIVGDRLVNSDILGGSIALGGLSYFRDFALDPYMVRNRRHYEGAVSPLQRWMYANGQLVAVPHARRSSQRSPSSSEATIRYVIRDAFGPNAEGGSAILFSSGLRRGHDRLSARRDDIGGKWAYDMPLFLAIIVGLPNI